MQRIDDRLESLREAYLKRRRNLVRFFTARIGSAAEAEALVRDILLRLPAVRDAGDDPAALLYRIAADLLAERGQPGGGIAPEAVANDLAGQSADDPRLDELAAAIEALPPRAREAFRLHKLDGLSVADTARAMGVPESEAEKHIGEALKALLPRLT